MTAAQNPEFQDTLTSRQVEGWEGESELLRIPGLVILSHPDARRVGETAPLAELGAGRKVALSRLEPVFSVPGERGPGHQPSRPLDLPYLSRTPVHLVPGADGLTLERGASRTRVAVGAPKGTGMDEIPERRSFSAAEIERGVVLTLNQRIVLLLCYLKPIPTGVQTYGLIGESASIWQLRRDIRSAAELDVPVLLRGETGTGKELVARALHDHGQRRGPYVTVNMAALPPTLAAAELFGAARGAYTGADRAKPGLFRSAEGGTLFLDEIGETPPEVQALLLRALETRQIQAVGSAEAHRVDVRVIAATDADLESAIAGGRFRAPLLHRLAGYEIRLPALRERRDDVARLLMHFLDQEASRLGAAIHDTVDHRSADGESWPPARLVARLADDDWPGNVRQLRNVARRLVIARRDGVALRELGQLVERLLGDASAPSAPAPSTSSALPAFKPAEPSPPDPAGPWVKRYRPAADVGADELYSALERHDWRQRPAARALGISPATLYRMIEADPRICKPADLELAEIETALADCQGDRKAAARALRVSPPGLKRRMTELGLS